MQPPGGPIDRRYSKPELVYPESSSLKLTRPSGAATSHELNRTQDSGSALISLNQASTRTTQLYDCRRDELMRAFAPMPEQRRTPADPGPDRQQICSLPFPPLKAASLTPQSSSPSTK